MLTVLVIVLLLVDLGLCSWGDKTTVYRRCRDQCEGDHCKDSDTTWTLQQPVMDAVIGWSCAQDCSYSCMWRTVQAYSKHHRVPQFHGKWPFVRILGLQEPASVFASLLNLFANLYMIFWFVMNVSRTTAMYWVWMGHGIISVNAWIWSCVFHTMDTPTTEMADYFSALATVLFSLLAFCIRLVPRDRTKQLFLTSLFLAFFCNHVYTMATVNFDYGYNMKVNIASGGLNCLAWLAWFYIHRWDGPHIIPGLLGVVLVASSVALELLDFPPILWLLDSHALWHFATAPLPILWVRFTVADTNLLEKQKID